MYFFVGHELHEFSRINLCGIVWYVFDDTISSVRVIRHGGLYREQEIYH